MWRACCVWAVSSVSARCNVCSYHNRLPWRSTLMLWDSSWGCYRINTKRRPWSMTFCMRSSTRRQRSGISHPTSAVSKVTIAETGVTIFFSSSAGLAEQTDSHRGFQWNNSHLWGGVWNSGTLQQRIYRHVPHIRQQCRKRQVCTAKAAQNSLHLLLTSLSCHLPALLPGSRAVQMSCSRGWRRSTAARKS